MIVCEELVEFGEELDEVLDERDELRECLFDPLLKAFFREEVLEVGSDCLLFVRVVCLLFELSEDIVGLSGV